MKTALTPPTITVGVYDEWSAPAALAGDCRGFRDDEKIRAAFGL